MTKIGLTLPSFVEDPDIPITVARAAEDAGLDAVFVYDHMWRGEPPDRRPAIECLALLGAVAAETSRIGVGTLVARATLRPPATLANAFATVQRVSDGRLIAAIGSGDSQSRAENEAFGLDFGTMADRVTALHDTVRANVGQGYPVWVGGLGTQVREVVAIADGWNGWGSTPDDFATQVELVREVAPNATITWGGLARPSQEGIGGLADRLRPYLDVGTEMLIIGPIDSSNPENAKLLAEVRDELGQ
jgi:alkanesulfonate monooxygenase SsuD/methylene tetrahydromethanopterin reductase-like flavin-dependent oxidoreductase (luciferase family)